MKQISSNGMVFLVKEVSHLINGPNKDSPCFILGENFPLTNDYFIVINQTKENMRSVFISKQAYQDFGLEKVVEMVAVSYLEYLEDLKNIKSNPFY